MVRVHNASHTENLPEGFHGTFADGPPAGQSQFEISVGTDDPNQVFYDLSDVEGHSGKMSVVAPDGKHLQSPKDAYQFDKDDTKTKGGVHVPPNSFYACADGQFNLYGTPVSSNNTSLIIISNNTLSRPDIDPWKDPKEDIVSLNRLINMAQQLRNNPQNNVNDESNNEYNIRNEPILKDKMNMDIDERNINTNVARTETPNKRTHNLIDDNLNITHSPTNQ
ncbi:unnamed protein product [Didymodactylos carnosus]|uniref:Uncharacterized protein n=1 Tax=Didymodactylos carnosus TaxID=1234261 RepID=A0A815B6S9_9BILA|nr:unnamed protein product [Didymodactylos carnosus]CAF4049208.1 unnamed protein product [Didymodactylos carnosus]